MDSNEVIELDDGGIDKVPQERGVKPKEAKSLRDKVNSLLGNYATTEYYSVVLPSGKEISIRPSVFEDERLAAIEATQRNISTVQALEKRLIKGADVEKLPYFDELYILLKIREITFGPKIELNPINCLNCGKPNHGLTIRIDELPVTRANPPISNLEINIKLPKTGVQVVARYPMIGEENLAGFANPNDKLHSLVLSLNGETDIYVIKEFINQCPVSDIKELKNQLFNHGYQVDTEVSFICSHCGDENIIQLPLTRDFLPLS